MAHDIHHACLELETPLSGNSAIPVNTQLELRAAETLPLVLDDACGKVPPYAPQPAKVSQTCCCPGRHHAYVRSISHESSA